MNREYLLIRIACGDTSAEANNIVLTPGDKKAIEWYRAEAEKAEVLSFMHLMRID